MAHFLVRIPGFLCGRPICLRGVECASFCVLCATEDSSRHAISFNCRLPRAAIKKGREKLDAMLTGTHKSGTDGSGTDDKDVTLSGKGTLHFLYPAMFLYIQVATTPKPRAGTGVL